MDVSLSAGRLSASKEIEHKQDVQFSTRKMLAAAVLKVATIGTIWSVIRFQIMIKTLVLQAQSRHGS
jgi:hypothetical protein